MITVRICVGTYCYIAGGEQLAKYKFYVPDEIKDKVKFLGSSCLGCSRDEASAKPPYAKVGEVLISECTQDKLLDEIYKQLGIERK